MNQSGISDDGSNSSDGAIGDDEHKSEDDDQKITILAPMPYDEELIRLVPHYKNDWKKICKRIQKYFKVRVTPNFLRNRYRNLTVNDPKCPRLVFNTQMDLVIAQLVNKHGLNWNLIAKEMGILDPIKIKNRYYS